MNQVARDEELFGIAKDCFNFVTMFFEPINVSAPPIYHSALELSPLSSIVRKSYYHQRVPFPRVATGVPDSWDPSTAISCLGYSHKSPIAWSPCGQFVATQTNVAVEVRDALTFGLSTILQPSDPTSQLIRTFSHPSEVQSLAYLLGRRSIAYSLGGRSLACASDTAIIIWDIQTGGVVKEIQRNGAAVYSLVWSSDGGSIGTLGWDTYAFTVYIYDVASGTTRPPIPLQSHGKPDLWAHGESFRVRTTAGNRDHYTIDIFEVGSALAKIESFPIQPRGYGTIDVESMAFSPTTYRISFEHDHTTIILDLRNSAVVMSVRNTSFDSRCFSPDGSLFAASRGGSIHIRKYDADRFIPWGEFPSPGGPDSHLLFSPTSPSILSCSQDTLRLWRLDGPSVAPITYNQQLGTFSCSGTYMATARRGGRTVTITNLHSQNPSQFIDIDVDIFELGLTSGVLLVVGSEVVVTWLLTREGLVNGAFGNRRAGRGDSMWTVSTSQFRPWDPIFSVEGEHMAIKSDGDTPHIYNTRTGEVIDPAQALLHFGGPWYSLVDIKQAHHHPEDGSVQNATPEDDWRPSRAALKEGWVMNQEGRHLLWLPIEWRVEEWHEVQWFSDITVMRFLSQGEPITIKLCYRKFHPSPDSGMAHIHKCHLTRLNSRT